MGIPGSFGNFRQMLRHSASSKPDKQPAARKQEVPALQQEEPLTRGPPNSEMLLRQTVRRFTKRNCEAFGPRRLLCCVCSMSNSAANRICHLSTPIGNRLSWHCRRARGARGPSLVGDVLLALQARMYISFALLPRRTQLRRQDVKDPGCQNGSGAAYF